ncbi:FxLD family lanthipeptide [Parafrankia soli]|nr:FxLD family lanthipeptide [Parafrankia soli]
MEAITADATTAGISELELDVSIVEQGDAADALLCTTDNGCSTNKSTDC